MISDIGHPHPSRDYLVNVLRQAGGHYSQDRDHDDGREGPGPESGSGLLGEVEPYSAQLGGVQLRRHDTHPSDSESDLDTVHQVGDRARDHDLVEDLHRQHPCLAVFDADTLCFTGQYRILGPEIQPNGNLPWCAADKENRLLYTGYFNDCDHINEFRIDDLEWIRSIPIDRVVQHTQGGEMYDGLIYISCHDSWKKKHIYAIDPLTGHVSTVMERHAGPHLVESEGLTICSCEDGSFFHQLDVIYPCGVAIRRYSKD